MTLVFSAFERMAVFLLCVSESTHMQNTCNFRWLKSIKTAIYWEIDYIIKKSEKVRIIYTKLVFQQYVLHKNSDNVCFYGVNKLFSIFDSTVNVNMTTFGTFGTFSTCSGMLVALFSADKWCWLFQPGMRQFWNFYFSVQNMEEYNALSCVWKKINL